MVTLLSMLFLFTKFILIFELFSNFNRMFQIIFNPLRSGGNKSSYILKAAGLF